MASTRCPGRVRHWRIAFGTVGLRSPICIFCGSPNPKPLTDEEWAALIDYASLGNPGRRIREAIEARAAEAVADG